MPACFLSYTRCLGGEQVARKWKEMRIEGTLKTWNDERGFGFIEPAQGGQEIFVHIKAFAPRSGRPEIGCRLLFDVETTADGKKRAVRVEPVRVARRASRLRKDNAAQWGTASLFAIPGWLLLMLLLSLVWKAPGWIMGGYLLASLVCFMVYAHDKAAAADERRRVPEDTLLLLGLLGGWPGAILAQQFLRHKSNKAEFRAKFWITVVANIIGVVVLCSPLAAGWLGQV